MTIVSLFVTKIVVTRYILGALKQTIFDFVRGLTPNPTGRACSASRYPNLLALEKEC